MIRPDYSLNKNALNLGAITGVALSLFQMLSYSFSMGETGLQWLLYITIIVSILWGARKYRDEVNEGYLTFGQSFGFGFLVSLGAAVVFGFFNYLYAGFISPDFIPEFLDRMEMAMYESGTDEEQIEMFMELYRSFMGPGMFAAAMVMNFTFMGALISLVIAFFIKRQKPMFEQ